MYRRFTSKKEEGTNIIDGNLPEEVKSILQASSMFRKGL
jgi:hypothetical protein